MRTDELTILSNHLQAVRLDVSWKELAHLRIQHFNKSDIVLKSLQRMARFGSRCEHLAQGLTAGTQTAMSDLH